MKRTIILLFALPLIIWSATAFLYMEEPALIRMLKDKLQAYNESYPEEKVYIQTDKTFYKPGEDIWFNVSVLNSNSHRPTTISDVVYVELIDPKGNVASKVKLVVRDGTAHGDFSIPETMPGGLYQIQAFTNWMQNFGDKNFRKEIQVQRIITPRLLLKLDFERESYGAGDQLSAKLTITNLENERAAHASIRYSIKLKGLEYFSSTISADENGEARLTYTLPDTLKTADGLLLAMVENQGVAESISRSIPIILNNVSLQFFPEGGYTLANTNSTVAFKAVNEFGKGADVSGSIVDNENNLVCSFTSYHMGMGAFDFVPTGNKKYYARIESPAGNADLIPLPLARQNGLTIHLQEKNNEELKWRINASKNQGAYLIGQAHGEIYYAEHIALKSGENIFEVPIKTFPIGIVVFTLFNEDGVSESERLVFVNEHKGLNINLKLAKEKYEPREKVEVRIVTTDDNGKPVSAKLALAVVDDQLISFADDKQDNLLTSMLLSTEVKGEIQEPGFYFDPNEPKANSALDYLLMTQGWRRFTWSEVKQNSRTIVHAPEKVKNLNGRLQNKDGQGVESEVTLIELSGLKRVIKVQTTKDGSFLFRNIDPTISLLLIAKKPWIISVSGDTPLAVSTNLKAGTLRYTEVTEAVGNITRPDTENDERAPEQASMNMSMDDDVSALSEVVVVGYGTVERRELTSSIAVVYNNELDGKTTYSPIENILQGRVSGLVVQPQSGNPGAQSTIRIRGLSSLASGRNEPLYVIDGHPIGGSLNQNFSNGSMISPDDIESIEIMQSPEATALFGSNAANGVILITTKSRLAYYHGGGYAKSRAPKFSSLIVAPKRFSSTREFYVPEPVRANGERKDFRTTVYWNHTVVTNDKGVANVSFYNTDAVSAFRITAEGFSGTGLLGRSESVYYTQLPFSLDTKIPESLGFEDVMKLPVKIKNETGNVLNGTLQVNIPQQLNVLEPLQQNIQVPPHTSSTIWFTISPKGLEGKFPISIKMQSKTFMDEVRETIQVKPIGFPVRMSVSAKELDQTFIVPVHDVEKNSIRAELIAYPDVLTDLFAGAEAILQEPYGCFEQVSSSTFPNILALQFMKQSGQLNPAIEKRANTYIENGYKRLKAYEIKGGGFEWFGHPPAHEGLTAYGLIEFYEMRKVYNGVDEDMMQRTRDWLLSRRNGKGGFRQNSGKYGFSAASDEVTNAYITYALSETGTLSIEAEYKNVLEEVLKSKDMYRMALVASTAYNLNKRTDYEMLVNLFKEALNKNGFELKASHSIVRSYGTSLKCETIALWATTLMKETSTDLNLIQQCIQEILKSRSFGQFGSTQATTMALKALTDYAKWMRATREDGKILIYINNQLADQMEYNKEERKNLVLQNFSSRLSTEGNHQLRVFFDQTTAALPYSMNIQWYTKQPIPNDNCKVSLSTTLSTNSIKVNETVRLTTKITNKTTEGLPMIVAVIGIPSGLSVQPWQLKELLEKGVFDFYEIMNGNLIIYYREMSPSAQHIIHLDLKAEVPGTYTGTASSTYLYYTNEFKHWVQGNTINIQ